MPVGFQKAGAEALSPDNCWPLERGPLHSQSQQSSGPPRFQEAEMPPSPNGREHCRTNGMGDIITANFVNQICHNSQPEKVNILETETLQNDVSHNLLRSKDMINYECHLTELG